jgi:hypothetical protein
MGCKNLGCFEFFKSSFLIFKNNIQVMNILLLFLELSFRIQVSNLVRVTTTLYQLMTIFFPFARYVNKNEYTCEIFFL